MKVLEKKGMKHAQLFWANSRAIIWMRVPLYFLVSRLRVGCGLALVRLGHWLSAIHTDTTYMLCCYAAMDGMTSASGPEPKASNWKLDHASVQRWWLCDPMKPWRSKVFQKLPASVFGSVERRFSSCALLSACQFLEWHVEQKQPKIHSYSDSSMESLKAKGQRLNVFQITSSSPARVNANSQHGTQPLGFTALPMK